MKGMHGGKKPSKSVGGKVGPIVASPFKDKVMSKGGKMGR